MIENEKYCFTFGQNPSKMKKKREDENQENFFFGEEYIR